MPNVSPTPGSSAPATPEDPAADANTADAQDTHDPPAEHARVADQVRRLDAFVRGRLADLEKAQRDLDAREQKLDALQSAVSRGTAAFADQLAQAEQLARRLEDAGRDAARQSADAERPLADRRAQLEALDRSVDQRMARMQQMHKQAGEAVDKFLLRALRETKQEAADLVAPIKQELDAHLAKQTAALEQKVQAKIAELDVDVEEALAPLTSRFDAALADARRQADAMAGALPGRVERELAKLEADTAARVRDIAALAETAGKQIATSLARLKDNARQQADQARLALAAPQTPRAATAVETMPMDAPLQGIARRLKQATPAAKQGAA